MILYAAPLAVAMWIFFPRISTPFWAVPIDTGAGVSGLSDTMSPGDISSLSLSNKVAFRVNFYSDVPAPRDRYWRAMVLHNFNGRSWSGGDSIPDLRADEKIQVLGEPVRYQVTMEATHQHWLPALDVPRTWDLSNTFMGRMLELARVYPVDQRLAYTVESYTDYRANPASGQTARDWYLHLPTNSNPRAVELARQMRADAGSDRAYIEAILDKFHNEEFYYTLEPPPLGTNPVDRFLFDTQEGFCEHYASAFAVMMRSVDIPARVVLGYQGGEFNTMGEYLIVRQSDAHAWTEVWFEDLGWRRVDPTAAVAPERIEVGFTDSLFDGMGATWGLAAPSALLHEITLAWDALNAGWNEWVLGYGPDKQNSFMEMLGMDDPSWRKMMITLVLLVVALTLIISALLIYRYRPPPKDRATILYTRFVRKTGLKSGVGETPDAFAARATRHSTVDESLIRSVTSNYLHARYGAPDPQALSRLASDVSAIR